MSPDLSPDEFRQLGYRAIDILTDMLRDVHDAPARRPISDALRERLMHQSLAETPTDPGAILDTFVQDVLPYPMGNNTPRFFAWVNSPAAPLGILAELLAAGMNPSVAGGDHAATYIEHAVLSWIKAIMGYPAESAGLLASGGSMANLIGLAVMRHVKAEGSIRQEGFNTETAPMVIYTSSQGHSCIQKAVELLGIGSDYLRKIPVDSDFRMDIIALTQQIAADRAAGLRPVCIVASAGTVNTGAIDPLAEIAELCEAEDLWFHVDGAYGAVGILAEQTQGLYAGIERAESLALDPHKWLYMPVECGCVLVKDAKAMRDAFSLIPSYLRDDNALPWFSEFGPQQTRGFRALKLWMVLQQIGVEGYRESISRDITLAQTLRERIRARDDFELVAAGPLSITCFRYAPSSGGAQPCAPTDETHFLNQLNRDLIAHVHKAGRVFITSTELNGEVVLRACIVNFRMTENDLDILLDEIERAGQSVLATVTG